MTTATKAISNTELLIKKVPGLKRELYDLLVAIKKNYDWCWLDRNTDHGSNDEPSYVDVTIGCTFCWKEGEITWNYQTGDNSYTGGAYGHSEWFTTSLLRRSNCKELAADLAEEIAGRIHELGSGFFPFGD